MKQIWNDMSSFEDNPWQRQFTNHLMKTKEEEMKRIQKIPMKVIASKWAQIRKTEKMGNQNWNFKLKSNKVMRYDSGGGGDDKIDDW